MGYKLVPPQELYQDDIPNIVRPFVAKRVLQSAFTFSATSVLGLRNYVSPLGNTELQQQKLIRDIENGRIILLATSSEFGTLGSNYTGHGQSGFDFAIEQIRRSSKTRPLWGYTRDDDDSMLDYAEGVYMGAKSYVVDLVESKLEFISDLAGSAIYEHTGYEGAREAHNRTLKRGDALVEELKQVDGLVDGLSHLIQHPIDTATVLLDEVKKEYDKHQQLFDQGKKTEAGLMLGAAATQLVDVVLDSPAKKAKKAAKLGKIVKDIDPKRLALPGHKGKLSKRRNMPGVASTGGKLPSIKEGDRWPKGSHGNAGKIPKQVADKLSGKEYKTFDDLRKDFWKEVGNDPVLSKRFNPGNKALMKAGYAPYIKGKSQRVGARKKYELDHNIEIQHGGSVYDLDNIIIRTPLNHIKGK